MRKLFDQFERLSYHVQELMNVCSTNVQDGFAPSEAICEDITNTLKTLRSLYDDIRKELPKRLPAEELPEGELSVRAYEDAWNNSIVKRQKAIRDVLEEFTRVYSDEKKYMDEIALYICNAQALLSGLSDSKPPAQLPDVSIFRLFLDCLKADLHSDEALNDRLMDESGFSPRIVFGLQCNKYAVRDSEETVQNDPDDHAQAPKTKSKAHKREDAAPSDGATPPESKDVSATDAQEKVIVDERAIDDDEAYIHPIRPIASAKLPSDKRLKDLIERTGELFFFLIEELAFVGLLDVEIVVRTVSKFKRPFTREQCMEALALLERRGLLCMYEYDGRNIVCFTELMEACQAKEKIASTLKRIYSIKNLKKINMVAKQDMPLSQFTEQLKAVDVYEQFVDVLLADNETSEKIHDTRWNPDRHCFQIILASEEGDTLPLCIIGANEFVSFSLEENEGALCYAETLPNMDGVTDHVHYCLTTSGLYQWTDGKWLAITHGEPTDPSDGEKPGSTDSDLSDTPPDEGEAAPDDTPLEKQTPSTQEDQRDEPIQSELGDVLLDDLSEGTNDEANVSGDELATLSASDIAARLIEAGGKPSDESMAALIRRLLEEGVRSGDVSHCQDQLVEAIVLGKVLSYGDDFPTCKKMYRQLHAAIPFFHEAEANTGDALSVIFAEDMAYTPVTKLCAYIYGMLFPARAHDHTFQALYNNAFADYDAQFPGLEILKPLYHSAMEGLERVPTAFSPVNLAALSDSKMRRERLNSICLRARDLIKPPTINVMIRGLPELIDICFGTQTDLHASLETVAANDVSMMELVEGELKKYCVNDEINMTTVERLFDSQWSIAAQKYPSRRMGIKHTARKKLLRAFEDRLNVLQAWLNEANAEASPDVEKLRPLRNEALSMIDTSILQMDNAPYSPEHGIMKASLELIQKKLQHQETIVDLSTMLRSGALVIDQGDLILNDDLNAIEFAEPWRMMLVHIACTEYDLRAVYQQILDAGYESTLYDNFGQLEAIGRLIGANPKEYELTDERLQDAINSANLQAKNYQEKLEISYAYNRIGENDRERLAMLADPETSDFQEFFYEHRAFGCWRRFLEALKDQIREISQRNMQIVRALLDQAKAQRPLDADCPLLSEAERLITQDQNYAVAEDYIHRFQNGETALTYETSEDAMNHFLDFVSDDVYKRLYDFCEKYKNKALSNWAMNYVERHKPENWTTRHINSARDFIDAWPVAKQRVNTSNIQDYFSLLGLRVEGCKMSWRGHDASFTLTVERMKQNLADYSHPIAQFGTQMKRQIEVVCLFGKRMPRQLINEACELGIRDTFIILLDANLSNNERRGMAEYFFTQKTGGQSSFLVIDRVLMLYLAMLPSNERLPAMLECTLPYTSYQPFVYGSGSTADEMFFGRVSELASIRDMNGTSIVYGGRQLGKTALLERAMHLDHNPEHREFAIKADFKGHRGEEEFLQILIPACNDAFKMSGMEVSACTSIKEFCSQIRRLLDSDQISTLRLLLDETDDFLDSISSTSYKEIQPLIELQRNSNRRFKFVLAGLHNVCRAKNATRDNGLFGQLGHPLCVRPLRPADARNLLVRPLRYLGFRVTNESHVDTILTNTNYYPGIIQFFGYQLVQTLTTNYAQYYGALKGNPPYELHDDQLASIMNSRDMNANIKERLRWTLEMDDRYYMLARCITVLYHDNESHYSEISNGFDVRSIRDVADIYGIHCLESLSEREITALLDEMEEMGILSRPHPEESRYLLRRRTFIDIIGANLEALEHDIKVSNEGGEDHV